MKPHTYTFQIFRGADQQWRWRLMASNGRKIATSGEGFSSKAAARRAARNVSARAGGAKMDTQK